MFLHLLLITLCAQVTFGRVLAASKCDSESDCFEGHSCHEKICKKCLNCDILFRKGSSCVTDFNNCGDCLTGYEEVLVTDFSTVKKPCRLLRKKIKSKKCKSDNNCPPNNYCNEESCVKCFNCSLVNRLPSVENCARDLSGCGSCMTGFYEIAVTTELNSKPCEKNSFVISHMSNSYKMSISNIVPIVFLVTVFASAILTLIFKKFRGNVLNKTTYHLPICPSAPPLYTMDAPQKIKKIEKKDSPRTCIKVEKQQARVFKQPDALYYYAGEEADEFNNLSSGNNDITASGTWPPVSENTREMNCSARISTHIYPELDVNNYLINSNNEELNQTEIREGVSSSISSTIIDVVDATEVAEANTERGNTLGQMDNSNQVKCRKCRHLLFFHPEVTLFNGHGNSYSNPSVKYINCSTIQEDNIWFLQDNSLPQWISDVVNNSNWTKGKINCPNCHGRLGSFDFVSGTQCQCGSHVLPAVHIIKCKVDCRNMT